MDKTNENPLVSIITPVYKAELYIEGMIESVQAQTYENWELIMVDDKSPDRSSQIIKKYAAEDNRIRLISLNENSGAAIARNTAIENSNGKYIAFLDSDDQWLPAKLTKQIHFMETNHIDFSFTEYENMTVDGVRTGKVIHIPEVIDYEGLLRNTIIGCLTVMINREKVKDIKMVNMRTRQDFVLWLSILKRGYKAYGLQENLALYRKGANSISSNKLKAAKQNWYVYRKIEKLSLIKTVRCFLSYAMSSARKHI
ncbi:glycosyltransferase family 2 protein [Bacillus suaedae]|uniref:Glycosyltransferase family 2 protein n=1 Tax=Halalkalibacter suaedae TaxID=2822140 RepID=A0A940WQQ8_9BACI|nr:glycosyltransferase family 2 protein [Bacillus suaedae]MBP3950063.1 glycosyltransferase family 2 protein [Bacillus suaedae]